MPDPFQNLIDYLSVNLHGCDTPVESVCREDCGAEAGYADPAFVEVVDFLNHFAPGVTKETTKDGGAKKMGAARHQALRNIQAWIGGNPRVNERNVCRIKE